MCSVIGVANTVLTVISFVLCSVMGIVNTVPTEMLSVDEMSSAIVQIAIITALTQVAKGLLEGWNVNERWFPVAGLVIGNVTQLILIWGTVGVDKVNIVTALVHGTVFGLLSCGTFDNLKAIFPGINDNGSDNKEQDKSS